MHFPKPYIRKCFVRTSTSYTPGKHFFFSPKYDADAACINSATRMRTFLNNQAHPDMYIHIHQHNRWWKGTNHQSTICAQVWDTLLNQFLIFFLSICTSVNRIAAELWLNLIHGTAGGNFIDYKRRNNLTPDLWHLMWSFIILFSFPIMPRTINPIYQTNHHRFGKTRSW